MGSENLVSFPWFVLILDSGQREDTVSSQTDTGNYFVELAATRHGDSPKSNLDKSGEVVYHCS